MRLSFVQKLYDSTITKRPSFLSNFNENIYNVNPREITWFTNTYVNTTLGGSEYMCHEINKYLVKNGFKINIIGLFKSEVFEDVQLICLSDIDKVHRAIGSSKFIFAQNYLNPDMAIKIGSIFNKQVVVFLHTNLSTWDIFPKEYIHRIDSSKLTIVYNSNWLQTIYALPARSLIIHPPARDTARIHTNTRDYVTIVTTYKMKGGNQFKEIAKRMPDIQFLGVRNGGIFDPSLTNVKYIDKIDDIRKVYSSTDIILMPSEYESWGMVAGEAIANGIPVIVTPTPGLKEHLDYAGLFVELNDIDGWACMIRKLKDNSEFYEEMVQKCKQRAEELQATHKTQLEAFYTLLSS